MESDVLFLFFYLFILIWDKLECGKLMQMLMIDIFACVKKQVMLIKFDYLDYWAESVYDFAILFLYAGPGI